MRDINNIHWLLQIQVIENINHLTELRVLNLAGNRITFVDNLVGMVSLAELNLRRNQIHSLVSCLYSGGRLYAYNTCFQYYVQHTGTPVVLHTLIRTGTAH